MVVLEKRWSGSQRILTNTIRTYLILGFFDDDPDKTGGEFYGYEVLGSERLLETKYNDGQTGAVIAIKDGKVREWLANRHNLFSSWETIVHPNAVITSSSKWGRGGFIFPNVTVSVDTVIGDFVLLYIQAVVLNDSEVDNYSSVMENTTVADHKRIADRTEVKDRDECVFVSGARQSGSWHG